MLQLLGGDWVIKTGETPMKYLTVDKAIPDKHDQVDTSARIASYPCTSAKANEELRG
jgi:hypothetical protein